MSVVNEIVDVINGLWNATFVPADLVDTTRAEEGGSITHTIKTETVPMIHSGGYAIWMTVAGVPNASGSSESAKEKILEALGVNSGDGQVVALAHVYNSEIGNWQGKSVYVTPVPEDA